MTINYKFNGEYFDYEVDYDRYLDALHNIMLKESKENLIDMLINADGCVVDLKEDFEYELKDYFEEEAYKEYLDRRYE